MFEKSKEEYDNLPENEWIGQWFCETSGGYAAARETRRQRINGTWGELPNVYCLFEGDLKEIWIK